MKPEADKSAGSSPAVVVLSSLFPNALEPGAGVFIRERMFRVGQRLPLTVVAPRPWFPGQSLLRRFRSGYRPEAAAFELMQGVEVFRPRFLSVPGLARWLDAMSMALAALPQLRRLARDGRLQVLDAHFAWPDGVAASWLGSWLKVPVVVTLRGTEVPVSRHAWRRAQLVAALNRVDRVLAVADALLRHVRGLGVQPRSAAVVGNGVDIERFRPEPWQAARERIGLPVDARVLVSVGGLCERKGFHRVIEVMPTLLGRHPGLHLLIVGGAGPEGNWGPRLAEQARALGLSERVHLLGRLDPEELRWPLSAADVFVLATRNEGWANVFLEALACGLPVVTTDVGGNAEVISHPGLGRVVPFGDAAALTSALDEALDVEWDRSAIRDHALANAWEKRVAELVRGFHELAAGR